MNEDDISREQSAASQTDMDKAAAAQAIDGGNAVANSEKADAGQPEARVIGKADPELLNAAREWARKRANSGEACLN